MTLAEKTYTMQTVTEAIRHILLTEYGLSQQAVDRMIVVGKPIIQDWLNQYQQELPTHHVLRDVAADLYEFVY